MIMKKKALFLFFVVILLVSACNSGRVVTLQPADITTPKMTIASSTAAPAGQMIKDPTAAAPTLQALPADQDNALNQPNNSGTPPLAAINACAGKNEQDSCEFTSQKGQETGVCETVQNQLACSPKHGPTTDGQAGSDETRKGTAVPETGSAAYNIEQAISDKAQGMTIAFDALAFITGDLGSDSFFPPGKVADFWGFQYLRDNDPSQMGHAGDFLTSAALNTLNNLTESQRAELVALARSQVSAINEYGYKRFVLMDAFRRLVSGDLPDGTTGLDEEAIKAYSAELYRLDGEISYARAQLMGSILSSLSAEQKAYFDSMVGEGMLEWPNVEEPSDVRGLDRDIKVAVMTYAADMFSWYAGSVDADVYFCPERHGTYFGSFYLKDIPAMGNPEYAISTNLTGDMGDKMLSILNADQAQQITGLVDIQRPYLLEIVETRKEIATQLRLFKVGDSADGTAVLSLMEKYGQLDGEIIYNLAIHFTQVSQSLTGEQKAQLLALRKEMLGGLMYPSGAYLYSQSIPMPEIPSIVFLFR
jgi:Spy/CpxP family protein refolding chaperone